MNSQKKAIYLTSFSGAAAELKKSERNPLGILAALKSNSRVSTFDMCELPWLCNGIDALKRENLIVDVKENYPWLRYKLSPAGEAKLKPLTPTH